MKNACAVYVAEDNLWVQPVENSLDAILHGMKYSDGVEFDLRLTKDKRLILHHDPRDSDNRYLEEYESDELDNRLIYFDELLEKSEFVDPWIDQAKISCIELKAPHPKSRVGGGWFGNEACVNHMKDMIQLVNENISAFDIPKTSKVIYSFEPLTMKAARAFGDEHDFAQLMPHLRQWGTTTVQRMMGTPSFISHSLPRLVERHRAKGSPLLPCASTYLFGLRRHLTLGRTISLTPASIERLNQTRKGYPIYVWPAYLKIEHTLQKSGITTITDNLDPNLYTLPGGDARWVKPATQPLSPEQKIELELAPIEMHKELIEELRSNVTPWHELSPSQRRAHLSVWRKNWCWEKSLDELFDISNSNRLPWEVVRMVGHRGTGKNILPNYSNLR
jgi:hypothetical protein